MVILEELVRQALILVLVLSGLPLLVSSVCGLCVSVLQAATQIQEQSVSFVVRFLAVSGVIFLGAGWFCDQMIGLFQKYLGGLGAL